jgi:hypothetical protein
MIPERTTNDVETATGLFSIERMKCATKPMTGVRITKRRKTMLIDHEYIVDPCSLHDPRLKGLHYD